jgi:hypothetical protein
MSNTIHDLSGTDALAGNDEFPLWQAHNRSTRKTTLATLAASIHGMIEGEPDETQYSLAASNGTFSLLVVPASPGGSVWAKLKLTVPAASGTITLPAGADRGDGQEVLVTATSSVAALTVSGGDAPVRGAPLALGVNGFFRLRYDSVDNDWSRVG